MNIVIILIIIIIFIETVRGTNTCSSCSSRPRLALPPPRPPPRPLSPLDTSLFASSSLGRGPSLIPTFRWALLILLSPGPREPVHFDIYDARNCVPRDLGELEFIICPRSFLPVLLFKFLPSLVNPRCSPMKYLYISCHKVFVLVQSWVRTVLNF